MKVDELVSKLRENKRVGKVVVDSDAIVVCDDSYDAALSIPKEATNWLDIEQRYYDLRYCFGKPSREYISAQIDEYLQTPIKERFPEKKYYLNARPEALEQYGSNDWYISNISYGTEGFSFYYGPATEFSESWLAKLQKSIPVLAEAIDAMKEPVEDKQ